MYKFIFKILVITFSTFFISCQPDKDDNENVIAQVNDAYVTLEELQSRIPEGTGDELRSALMRQFMEQWVEEEIFYQTAINEQIELSKNQTIMVENYRRNLLIQSYIEDKISKPYRILDKEIEDYYNLHKEEFIWSDDHAHIIHLVMENRDSKIFSEIRKSKDLLDIIKSYFFEIQSTPSRPIGDLGYVKVSDLDENIAKKIKQIKTGAISSPIKLPDGYHFIQLLDFQKAKSQQDFEIVKDEIILRLKIAYRRQELVKIKRDLRTNFKIETNTSKLINY